MLELNKVHHGDCLELMKLIPDKSIDLVLTDPPYFGIVKDDWDNQWDTREEFIEWLEECTKERKRILKDNGSLYIFGDDKIIAYVQVMMDKYFKLENSIIWNKGKGYLTSKGWGVFRSYATVTERLLFYSNEYVGIKEIYENKSNFKNIKEYLWTEYKNTGLSFKEINIIFGTTSEGGGGMAYNTLSATRNNWDMPKKEYYEKLQKATGYFSKPYEELRKEYEELRRPFNPASNYTDVRQFNIITQTESSKADHPTQKPIDIIKRIIDTSSKVGNVILDCFLGSGTTAVACKELGRNFIGIEKEKKYVDIANKRLTTTSVGLFN